MPDGSETPISGFRQKIETRQELNEQEVGAAQAELARMNPQENRSLLSQLRASIEAYFTEAKTLSEPVRAKLEELRNSLPSSEEVITALDRAASHTKEAGTDMLAEGIVASQDIVEDLRKGNFMEIPGKYPVVTGVLAFTGLAWLSGKILTWYDGKRRGGFFSKLLKVIATVTGVSFLARVIAKSSQQQNVPHEKSQDESPKAPSEKDPVPPPSAPKKDSPTEDPASPSDKAPTSPTPTPPSGKAPETQPKTPSASAPRTEPVTPKTSPNTLPASVSFADFQRGVDIGGYKVQITKPDIIAVNGQRWKLTHPKAAVTFDDVSWSNGKLSITAGPLASGLRFFSPAETSTLNEVQAMDMLRSIAKSKADIPIPAAPGKKASGAVLKKV